jgi:TolA-binding protein
MGDEVVGLVAVVLLFGGGTLFLLAISPIGKALAAKMLGRTAPVADDDEIAGDVKELRQEIGHLRGELEQLRDNPSQLAELNERVDFLERMIAKQREADRLPPVR